jgi:hypothetical protein
MSLRAVLALVVLAGCSPYGRRIPDGLVRQLPYEAHVELLEAENDLALAIDRVDQAENEVSRTRENLRRAKSRLHDAEREVDKAEGEKGAEVARLAVREAEARIRYLRARQDINVELEGVEALALLCARARYEVSRVNAARKAKVAGAEGYDPKDFEAQAKACETEVVERRAELRGVRERADAAKQDWDQHKQALAQRTFDARASPYVE